jgi:hypothetical protein
MTEKKEDRCWPGYEPVKGKKPNSQGSCRPKAESKLTSSEKKFRTKRRRQLDEWQDEHPDTRRSAAQHLSAPGTKKKTPDSKPPKPKSSGPKKARTGSRKPAKRKR